MISFLIGLFAFLGGMQIGGRDTSKGEEWTRNDSARIFAVVIWIALAVGLAWWQA